jgi:glycolate oxidase
LDKTTIKTIENYNPVGLLTDKEAMLLIELDGFRETLKYEQKILKQILENSNSDEIIQAKTDEENENIWKTRRSAFSALAQLKPNVVTEDIVVPRTKIVDFVKFCQSLAKKYNIITAVMGHAADGNIHPNFALDLDNEEEKGNFEKLKDELFNYAISIDGTLSGEHGIGTHKKKYIKNAISPETLSVMKNIKNMLDSKNIFNPNKAI